MRLPLAHGLETRDGSLDKDAIGINTVIEVDGDNSAAFKRPGNLSLGSLGVGAGKLLACHNGNLKAVIGDELADVTITSGAASVASSSTMSAIDLVSVFASQVAGQAQGNNVLVLKNGKEAWIYTP